MKEIVFSITAIGLVVTAIAVLKKMHSRAIQRFDISHIPEETIEGELHFKDIADFLKATGPKKEVHIPFIGFNINKLFKKGVQPAEKLQKDGYFTILLGIYNKQQDNLEVARIIHYKSMDDETTAVKMKAEDGIVVLN